MRRPVRRLRPGSYLSLSHSTASDAELRRVQDECNNSGGASPTSSASPRSRGPFFHGLGLVAPGMVSWPNCSRAASAHSRAAMREVPEAGLRETALR
ncbi:SAM-dependent methyltransferase [Streptomyces candidus]|nr:SAM-dependent methyltransferase [Streptomyces candidus]